MNHNDDIRLLTHLLPHLACEADLVISDHDRHAMLHAVWALHDMDRAGRRVSNRGNGWQAEITNRAPFAALLDKVRHVSGALLRQYTIDFEDLAVTSFWANINFERDFNITHRHGGHLSGVCFLDVQDGCGDLVLGSTAAYYVTNPLVKLARNQAGENFIDRTVKPVNGHAVIFSSETNHSVDCNLSGKPRVSIAWNMSVNLP